MNNHYKGRDDESLSLVETYLCLLLYLLFEVNSFHLLPLRKRSVPAFLHNRCFFFKKKTSLSLVMRESHPLKKVVEEP